jgi:integrase
VSVYDRWHLKHPPEGAKKCGRHRKVPSAEHETGLQWQVRGSDADGRPLPKESFAIEQDARDRDAELRTAVRSGTLIDEKGGKVTFQVYAEKWRKAQTHDHSSAERIEAMLRLHVYEAPGAKGKTPGGRAAIGGYQVGVLGRRVTLVRDWVGDLKLRANSQRLLIGAVEAIFTAAVDDLLIGRNPLKAKSVSKPKRTATDVVVWVPDEVEAVCGELPGELRAMGYLGAVTGPRQGELFGLAKGDIDFLRRTVHYEVQVAYVGGRQVFRPLKNHKTRKSRDVPVAATVIPVLSEHMRLHPPVAVTLPWSERGSKMDGKPVTRTLVFTDPGGRPYYRQTVNRHWRRAWLAAGIADQGAANGMHILRHTAASRWLSKGLNPAKVAAFLGDTVGVVLDTYAHWLPDDDDRGRAIMEDYLTPGTPPSQVPEKSTDRPENALRGS